MKITHQVKLNFPLRVSRFAFKHFSLALFSLDVKQEAFTPFSSDRIYLFCHRFEHMEMFFPVSQLVT